MLRCDINCDMGEGIGNDALIMPFITSANIACGFHAGDEKMMQATIRLAKKYRVSVGAHPSFMDPENFGRSNILKSQQEIYELVTVQIQHLQKIAAGNAVILHHVKPHGALYNMAAKDKIMAGTIANAVKDIDEHLILYGLSNSYLISEAKAVGLKTASEVFADRTYQDDGSLTPRLQPNALIKNVDDVLRQVSMMLRGSVSTVTGLEIPIVAETICVHGDGSYAVDFAKAIHGFVC